MTDDNSLLLLRKRRQWEMSWGRGDKKVEDYLGVKIRGDLLKMGRGEKDGAGEGIAYIQRYKRTKKLDQRTSRIGELGREFPQFLQNPSSLIEDGADEIEPELKAFESRR